MWHSKFCLFSFYDQDFCSPNYYSIFSLTRYVLVKWTYVFFLKNEQLCVIIFGSAFCNWVDYNHWMLPGLSFHLFWLTKHDLRSRVCIFTKPRLNPSYYLSKDLALGSTFSYPLVATNFISLRNTCLEIHKLGFMFLPNMFTNMLKKYLKEVLACAWD